MVVVFLPANRKDQGSMIPNFTIGYQI